jgi:hypothetical protein
VGDIISEEPQPTRFSGLGTYGLLYLMMSVKRSEPVSIVKNLLGRSNSSLFL